MPRTQEYSDHYADALVAMAVATQRPANVVNTGSGYAIRVDFEFRHYLLAVNDSDGLREDGESGPWSVRFFQVSSEGGQDELLVEAIRDWLVDAYDAAYSEIRETAGWLPADAEVGESRRATTE
ncbi:MAG: hypothetical protein WAW17_23850 [Rhodococcus sp. (in: high G+C Gram-positive bacteria)]|uniref:hypothetical protein n=1 Tax=Rhodococcus sp. TaxID=1831 RepID=UPI003BB17347